MIEGIRVINGPINQFGLMGYSTGDGALCSYASRSIESMVDAVYIEYVENGRE